MTTVLAWLLYAPARLLGRVAERLQVHPSCGCCQRDD